MPGYLEQATCHDRMGVKAPKPGSLAQAVCHWFASKARDMPWRSTRDPYAIWVSEIMLQQTQVKTVIPYWERWMRRFPDIRTLAKARESQVLKAWEGLGYYSRARNLQRAARRILEVHNGVFPAEFETILSLPGIGRYTAGAICSTAFGAATPAVDGNVGRVLSRLFGIRGNVKASSSRDEIWKACEKLVQEAVQRGGNRAKNGLYPAAQLNQGLIEIGALICRPSKPLCELCPVKKHCFAFQNRLTDRLPETARRKPSRQKRFAALVLADGDKYLVRQRADGQVNGGLWEFPNMEVSGKSPREELQERFGLANAEAQPFIKVQHAIMNDRITLEVFLAIMPGGAPANVTMEGHWMSLKKLRRLPFSSAHAKIRTALSRLPFGQ